MVNYCIASSQFADYIYVLEKTCRLVNYKIKNLRGRKSVFHLSCSRCFTYQNY